MTGTNERRAREVGLEGDEEGLAMSVLDHEDARESLALAEARAGPLGLPLAGAWAHCAAADVALAAGEHGAAAERAIGSADCPERAGGVIEEALSRTLAGQALALAGDRGRAIAELQRAATALDGCGASRLRNAAERELRKLGRPVDRRSRKGSADGAGVATLTEREHEVAALVDRTTNPEIAAELILSPRRSRRTCAHLPQARRLLARRARTHSRTRAPRP